MSSPPPVDSRSEAEGVLDSIRLKGIKRVTTEFIRNARQSRAPKSQEGHIPRPMNAFILFTTISPEHGLLQEHYPRRKELLRHLGDIWRSTDWKRRKPYQDVATELTNEHKRLYPDYMFKPRPKKKSTNRDSTRALKATPPDSPKVGYSFGAPKTQEKTQKAEKETQWITYDPSSSPHNLLEYAHMPTHCLTEVGSDRSPSSDISPPKVLDAIPEEASADQFLYRFYEDLQSPSQRHYGIAHNYADPSSPSKGDTPDELRTPLTQDTSLANPKSMPRTASVNPSILISNTQPYAADSDIKPSSRKSRSSDAPLGTEPSHRNLVVYVDDSETRHARDGRHLPNHQDDSTISGLPQSPSAHDEPVSGRSTGDQTPWLDSKNEGIQHLPFYRLFTCEQSASDETDIPPLDISKNTSGENVGQDPLSWEERMVFDQAGTPYAPAITQRNKPNGFSTSPGTERLRPMSLSTGTFDLLEYPTILSDQYQYDHFPTSSGSTVHAEHFQQYRPDLYRYTLTHPPIGETIPSHYIPGARAAFCDASNLQ